MAMARKSSLLSVTLLGLVASFMIAAWSSPRAYVPGAQGAGRRELLQGLTGAMAATVGSQAAWADAFGSRRWALSKYAPRVMGLREQVEAGNMTPLLEREGSFKALNGYWMFNEDEYAAKNQLVSDMFEAAEKDDKARAADLYNKYLNDPVFKEWSSLTDRRIVKKHIQTAQNQLFTGQETFGSKEGRGI